MGISPQSVRFDDDSVWVNLSDGRVILVPLAWFPRLLDASDAQRHQFEISRNGLHRDCINEDVWVRGLLAGRGDRARHRASVV